MKKTIALVLSSIAFGVSACAVDAESNDPEELVSAQSLPQLDPGTFNITQSAATVASAWHGIITGGTPVEYWVKKPTYSAGSARSLTGGSQTCSNWKTSVCGTGWTGATYYQATYTQSALNCASPPSTITPPGGATSFLGSGSWHTADGAGAQFAWTYVTGNVEYWAMKHLISASGTSTQSPHTPAYSSFTNFTSTVCAMGSPPTTWFTAYYVPIANFCSTNPC